MRDARLGGSNDRLMMSPELQGVVDEADIFGDDHLPSYVSPSPDVTRRPQVPHTFTCMVTLSDGEERSGDVLGFVKGHVERSVAIAGPTRLLDDIATSSHIERIRVLAASGAEVFDVCFDPEVESDVPTITYDIINGLEVVSLRVDVDSYE